MKKFNTRSKKGQRNLLILYAMIISGIILMVAMITNASVADNTLSDTNIYMENIDETTITKSPAYQIEEKTEEKMEEDNNMDINNASTDIAISENNITISTEKIPDENTFVNNLLKLVGCETTLNSNDFLNNIISQYADISFNNFYPVNFEEIVIGDIARTSDDIYGIFIGYYEGKHIFVCATQLENIYNLTQNVIAVVYDITECDDICMVYYPLDFVEFYHCDRNSFSLGNEVQLPDVIIYSSDEITYAAYVYRTLEHIIKKDYAAASEYINTSSTYVKSFSFSTDLFLQYVNSFADTTSNNNYTDIMFQIKNLYNTSTACIVNITLYKVTNEHSLIAVDDISYTYFFNGTFLPFNVFTESVSDKYGFVELKEGECFSSQEDGLSTDTDYQGVFIQREDGTWIYRYNGIEIDLSSFDLNGTTEEGIEN